MVKNYIFTSESVAPGHPDKICDQISDNTLDLFLQNDENARTAIEVLALPNKIVIGGEIASSMPVKEEVIIEETHKLLDRIGYNCPNQRFSAYKIPIEVHLNQQSPEIIQGVIQASGAIGAGDQGMMFGHASRETDTLMPASIYYSHKLLVRIFEDIALGRLVGLGPDAKAQISLEYQNRIPVRVTAVVLSIQHNKEWDKKRLEEILTPYIIDILPKEWVGILPKIYINPTGDFLIGGPESDSGLTGRKIIMDSYGGYAPHGGGAFSGKDGTKVDRSAAYMMRYLAKNIVAAGISDKCTMQIAYAIGIEEPVSYYLDFHNTGKIDEKEVAKFISENIELTPKAIIEHLGLRNPIYLPTATYGHFGRIPKGNLFSWEQINLVDKFKQLI